MSVQTIQEAYIEARNREFAYATVELIKKLADDSECSVLNRYYFLTVGGRTSHCGTPEEAGN